MASATSGGHAGGRGSACAMRVLDLGAPRVEIRGKVRRGAESLGHGVIMTQENNPLRVSPTRYDGAPQSRSETTS